MGSLFVGKGIFNFGGNDPAHPQDYHTGQIEVFVSGKSPQIIQYWHFPEGGVSIVSSTTEASIIRFIHISIVPIIMDTSYYVECNRWQYFTDVNDRGILHLILSSYNLVLAHYNSYYPDGGINVTANAYLPVLPHVIIHFRHAFGPFDITQTNYALKLRHVINGEVTTIYSGTCQERWRIIAFNVNIPNALAEKSYQMWIELSGSHAELYRPHPNLVNFKADIDGRIVYVYCMTVRRYIWDV